MGDFISDIYLFLVCLLYEVLILLRHTNDLSANVVSEEIHINMYSHNVYYTINYYMPLGNCVLMKIYVIFKCYYLKWILVYEFCDLLYLITNFLV
jgi:hypothetical protein